SEAALAVLDEAEAGITGAEERQAAFGTRASLDYDGVMGPGTGTFLIIAFTTIVGLDFVHASATAKIINTGTNLGALAVFAVQGHILWALGLGMAVCNVAGAQLGARMALRRGTSFVRVVLLVVVVAMVARLAWMQWG
ncbi:TSUP family transporter, partial [Nonomuraea sp. NPDC050310]|uniref:TSUP family transporter n=1 Tax=Nonomuraea sp. NPDC050310 TaxID=3154935 RepID=UPI0033CD110C